MATSDTWYIANATLITPFETHPDGTVVVRDGKIAAAGPTDAVTVPADAKKVDGRGKVVAPGLIDLHVNGYGGGDALTPDPASLKLMTRALARDGVTSFLATLITAPLDRMTEAAGELAKTTRKKAISKGAEMLGVYLEGPFLSPEYRGAHPAEHLRKPGPAALDFLLEAADGHARLVCVAPELPGALDILPRISAAGAHPVVGHTGADDRTLREAAEAGARHFTHLFNAMPRFHHRHPGPVGFALAASDTTAEIVADGVHVHPTALALAYRAMGPERLVLVSDCLAPAGMPPREGEEYDVGGVGRVLYSDGRLTTDDGTLAGATTSLLDGLRRMVHQAGVPLNHAFQMATSTPAGIAGVADRKGKIIEGMDADLILLQDDLTVERSYVRGKPAEAPLEA